MRWLLFITLYLLHINQSHAGFVLGLGVGVTTKHEDKNELVDFSSGWNLGANFEYILSKRITVDVGGFYRREHANSQYTTSAGILVPDLDSTASGLILSIGPRIRILNFDSFRLFIGGGLIGGNLTMKYSKSDFERRTGNSLGFDSKETQSLAGYYYEAGIEIPLSGHNALRILGRETLNESASFETLGDRKIAIAQTMYSLQYLQYIDF